MTQPPIPPRGGNEPDDPVGSLGWNPPGADDPTRKFDVPASEGQRNPTQQFGWPEVSPSGPPPHGQPPHGQPPHGQATYGQPLQGQPQYGQATNGQPPQGQPQYGQQSGQLPYPEYGQPTYGQPQYGQHPWGPPGGPGGQQSKKNSNTAVVLLVGAGLLLAVVAAGLFFFLRAGDPDAGAASSNDAPGTADTPSEAFPPGDDGIPSATVTPDGLGDDPDLDVLALGCYDGDMQACDDLYQVAEPDSLYGLYGGTCAGRQDIADADTIFCTNAFPED